MEDNKYRFMSLKKVQNIYSNIDNWKFLHENTVRVLKKTLLAILIMNKDKFNTLKSCLRRQLVWEILWNRWRVLFFVQLIWHLIIIQA